MRALQGQPGSALFLCLLLSSGVPAFAQTTEMTTIQKISTSSIDDERKMACAYSALLIEMVNRTDPAQLKAALAVEIQTYEAFAEQGGPKSKQTIKLQNQVLHDLHEAYSAANNRAYLNSSLELSCRMARTAGGALIQTTALSASLITSAVTLPIRFVGKFVIGAFTRSATPEKGLSYSDLLGHQGLNSQVISIAYELIRAAMGAGSPLAIPRLLITGIDLQAADRCKNMIPLNPKEKWFCDHYALIKRKEFQVSEVGERMGIKVGKSLVTGLDFRSDQKLNPELCHETVKKQYRLARLAKERLMVSVAEKQLLNVSVSVLPPEGSQCVRLKVSSDPGFESELNEISGIIDGIEIVKNQNVPVVQPSPATLGSPTPLNVCIEIEKQKIWKQSVKPELNQSMGRSIQFALNPARFAHLSTALIQTGPGHLSRQSLTEMPAGRNVILMIAPNEDQSAQYTKLQSEKEKLQSDLTVQRKKLQIILKADSASECEQLQSGVQFDWKEYRRLNEALASLQILQRIDEFNQMEKEAKKAGQRFWLFNNLKRNWEIVQMKTLNDLRALLVDPSVQNLVIVSHGDSDGKIIDSRFNELPNNAFGWITPQVQSVSFFSCHSQNAIKTYDLIEKLKNQDSFHALRIAGSVQSEAFLEKSNQVPTGALSEFIEALDRKLDLAAEGSVRVQTWARHELSPGLAVKVCSIELSGIKVENGVFGVLVNGNWVGSLYPESRVTESFTYPCSWNKEGKNTFFLENQSLVEKSRITAGGFQLKSEDLNLKASRVIRRQDDGSIKAIRFDEN